MRPLLGDGEARNDEGRPGPSSPELLQVMTAEELCEWVDRQLPKWGSWRLYPPTLVLVLLTERKRSNGEVFEYEQYEVDLERCLTSAEVLDWICQVAGKCYAEDAVLAGLVRAIDDVLFPQAHLCSFGTSKNLSRRRVAQLVAEAADRWPQLVHVRDDDDG